jgi:hypothetical protein
MRKAGEQVSALIQFFQEVGAIVQVVSRPERRILLNSFAEGM